MRDVSRLVGRAYAGLVRNFAPGLFSVGSTGLSDSARGPEIVDENEAETVRVRADVNRRLDALGFEGVIRQNLLKMLCMDEGCMPPLLLQESMGGNAGAWLGYTCSAANFHYRSESGLIVYFENSQNVPEQIRLTCQRGTLRLALDPATCKDRVVDSFFHDAKGMGRKVLDETIEAYNREFAFNPLGIS